MRQLKRPIGLRWASGVHHQTFGPHINGARLALELPRPPKEVGQPPKVTKLVGGKLDCTEEAQVSGLTPRCADGLRPDG